MIIVDLPIPAGFALVTTDLANLVGTGSIARFQVNPRSTVVYLRSLPPGEPLTLRYRLRATLPVKAHVPPVVAYEYYDSEKGTASRPARFVVAGSEG